MVLHGKYRLGGGGRLVASSTATGWQGHRLLNPVYTICKLLSNRIGNRLCRVNGVLEVTRLRCSATSMIDYVLSWARCISKTGRHDQDRSRRATINTRILTGPVLILATGLGCATRNAPLLCRIKVRLHDTTGCQTGCTTGLATGLTTRLYRVNRV